MTCKHGFQMSKIIQLRNVPDALHRALKARAARAGMPLSDYLLAEIKEISELPTLAEMRERLHKRKPVATNLDLARSLRKEREEVVIPGVRSKKNRARSRGPAVFKSTIKNQLST